MIDNHAAAALLYYRELTAALYPQELAASLAAAQYAHALMMADLPIPLSVVQAALVAAQQEHPELKREALRTVAAIDRKVKRAG